MKDLNDVHLAGLQISKLPLVPIDIYCAEQILKQTPGDEQAQQKAIEKYAKTIKNPLIRTDLAKLLVKHWDRELDDIKSWLKITDVQSVDEILLEFKKADQCIVEMENSILHHDGITIGYPTFDRAVGGLALSDVFFIAARPGVGKTFIAMETSLHLAIRLKMNVLFFSIEMSAAKLYKRLIANIFSISVKELEKRIKEKTINYEEVLQKIRDYIIVVDNPSLTVEGIEERIIAANTHQLFKNGKTQVVIIDYVQMMKGMGDFNVFEEKVMYFKPLARTYNILLIPLSQMARTTKTWEEPDVSNMKGGGSLEQVGDTIWLLWKESENPKTSQCERKAMEESGEDNIISSKIGKARNGLEGNIRYIQLYSNKETTSIRELA